MATANPGFVIPVTFLAFLTSRMGLRFSMLEDRPLSAPEAMLKEI
jgi:hypothetical protein